MNWDSFMIAEAARISLKSEDPDSQVGCVITDSNYTKLSYGWNRHPRGTSGLPWSRPDKYRYVIHAEMAALLSLPKRNPGVESFLSLQVFLSEAPCESCLRHMIDAGVVRIVYKSSSIMRRWCDENQFKTITNLILASGIDVRNIDGREFVLELAASVVNKVLDMPPSPPILATIPEGIQDFTNKDSE
jgi:dCMP deaminase